MILTTQWEMNTAHDYKDFEKESSTLITETTIFVRPAARQISGNCTLCMIVKVAYCVQVKDFLSWGGTKSHPLSPISV